MDLSSVNILIVDDNPHSRATLRTILGTIGVKSVIEADNADFAFDLLGQTPVDIVLTDYEMKPVGGLALVKRIRSDEQSPDPMIPVIMVTGHTEVDKVTAARDAGVTEFVAKPVSVRTVVQRLQSVIARPRDFVKAEHFFGPDRRRLVRDGFDGPRLREADKDPADEPNPAPARQAGGS